MYHAKQTTISGVYVIYRIYVISHGLLISCIMLVMQVSYSWENTSSFPIQEIYVTVVSCYLVIYMIVVMVVFVVIVVVQRTWCFN